MAAAMHTTGNFYKILGVISTASRDEIKARYYELARVHHPDRAEKKQEAHQIFVRINQAYQTLADSEKRSLYDERLRRERDRERAAAQGQSPGSPGAGVSAAASSLSPDEIQWWLSQANDAYLRADLEAAHAGLKRVIQAGKAPLEAYVLMGDVYAGQRLQDKALVAYRVALKMQPDNKMLQAKITRLESILNRPKISASAGQGRPAAPAAPPAKDDHSSSGRRWPFGLRAGNENGAKR